ncbi:MAG: hypothetical protein GEU79_17480 [Acidimicrobiia bacterium]|nr:hypothetical protein [Acidimicrobiia bacterium]
MSDTRHVQKDYATDDIVVHWDSSKCIHSANCLGNLPNVFDVRKRPWIRVEAADADAIVAAVDTCPSMALTYTRLDGGTTGPNAVTDDEMSGDTDDATPVVISLRPDGPLVVEGRVRIELARGEVIDTTERVKLCRCGGSSNKPYCDGTHREKGFQAEGW